MHDIAIAQAIIDKLASEIADRPTPKFDPLPCDSWIARSVMQKAIRRGMLELGLRAAAQLVLIDRRTLWRRLIITALEDLGPRRLETTAKIVFGSSARDRLAPRSGSWPLVAELVRQSCAGTKSQVTNDLWNIGLHHPAAACVGSKAREASGQDLRHLFADQEHLFTQAAVIVATSDFILSAGSLGADDVVGWCGSSHSELSRITYAEAFRLVRVPLAMLMLLAPEPDDVQSIAMSDDLAPVVWNGFVPTFALDQYTRAGKATLRSCARSMQPWQDFAARQRLSDAQSVSAFSELVFRLDGAAIAMRDQQASWIDIREISMVLGSGVEPFYAHEALEIIRAQLPAVDLARSRVPFPF